jgi:hypothetical protein
MSFSTMLAQRFRTLWMRAQPTGYSQPNDKCLRAMSKPPDQLEYPCPPEVLTWNHYLFKDIRDALLAIYSVEVIDEDKEAPGCWLESLPLAERLRIFHFDQTYRSYTVEDHLGIPEYCVWLTRDEIQSSVFSSPVPPFMGGEYAHAKHSLDRGVESDPKKIADLLYDEESMLQASQLLWSGDHFAVVQFYKLLPYNIEEHGCRGRVVDYY